MPPAVPADPYPVTRRERTRWIRSRRPAPAPRSRPDPVPGILQEQEPDGAGGHEEVWTVFLANRECPWTCLMCDLWRQAPAVPPGPGGVALQVQQALARAGRGPSGPAAATLKLYNAGSFFDDGAIPAAEREVIGDLIREGAWRRVVVENHPRLTDDRVGRWARGLGASRLEVAMGLETAHPATLARLNKGITLDDFQRAARVLGQAGLDLRVFVLVRPPFQDESEALEWACRSVDLAFECGARVVSLLPTRPGNGALEELARQGVFAPPQPGTVDAVLRHGLSRRRGLVLVDTWD
ncbi:MAG: hypothetical protein ACKOET_20305, partial [Verrucomicrobiota bacterium]